MMKIRKVLGVAMVMSLLNVVNLFAENSEAKKIKWDMIPEYTAQKVSEVDSLGQPVLNEDGSPKYRVFFVDQFGNRRSAETVKAQMASINKSIGKILVNVGVGAALGALGGSTSNSKSKGSDVAIGAAAGAAAGAFASSEEIDNAIKQKKSLGRQKKLLKSYEANFTSEGIPVDAKVDVSKIKGLDLKNETLSLSTAEIMKELNSDEFNKADPSAWEFDEGSDKVDSIQSVKK